LLAGLAGALAGCYPDPNDLRPVEHGAGGQVAGTGGKGGSTGGTSDAGSGGNPGGLGGIPGLAGRPGFGGMQSGAGGAGGKPAAGGAPGAGGRTGSGGAGMGGAGMGGAGMGGAGVGGSGGANASCGAPACGGPLVGTWDITASCTAPVPDDPANCPGETVSSAGIQRVGFITFNADFTYTSAETDSGTFIIDTPTSCLDGVTCAELDAAYQDQTQPPSPNLLSASCTIIPIGCRCALGIIPGSGTESGTYVVNGTKVITTAETGSAAGTSSTADFCVNGTTFRLIYPDSTPSAPQEAVFRKR